MALVGAIDVTRTFQYGQEPSLITNRYGDTVNYLFRGSDVLEGTRPFGSTPRRVNGNRDLRVTGTLTPTRQDYNVALYSSSGLSFRRHRFIWRIVNQVFFVNSIYSVTHTVDAGSTINILLPEASGGIGSISYHLSLVPLGTRWNSGTRRVTGTVSSTATPGSYQGVLTARDSDGAFRTCTVTWVIRRVTPVSLPGGNISRTIQEGDRLSPSITLPSAIDGQPPYTYSFDGNTLPSGISRRSRTISGRASRTSHGQYNMGWHVLDDANDTDSITVSITVQEVLDPMCKPISNQDGLIGERFSFTIPAPTGGKAPLQHRLTGHTGIAGLSFNQSSRRLSGTINLSNSAGAHNLTYTVTDDWGQTDTCDFTLTLDYVPLALPEVDDRSHPKGTTISAFTLPAATGGVPPYTYGISGLPLSIVFNSAAASRRVSGTITDSPGVSTVTYQVDDSAFTRATSTFSWTVEGPPAETIGVGSVTAGAPTITAPILSTPIIIYLGPLVTVGAPTRVFVCDNTGDEWWEITNIETGAGVKRGDLPSGLTSPSSAVSVGTRVFVCDDRGDEWWEITDIDTGAGVKRGNLPSGLASPHAAVSVGTRVFVCDGTHPEEWWEITDIDTGAAVKRGNLPAGIINPTAGVSVGTRAFVCDHVGDDWWEITDIDTGAGVRRGNLPSGLTEPRSAVSVGTRAFVCDASGDEWWEITDIETGAGVKRGNLPSGISVPSAAVSVGGAIEERGVARITAGAIVIPRPAVVAFLDRVEVGAITLGALTISSPSVALPKDVRIGSSITAGPPTISSPEFYFVSFKQIEGGSVRAGWTAINRPLIRTTASGVALIVLTEDNRIYSHDGTRWYAQSIPGPSTVVGPAGIATDGADVLLLDSTTRKIYRYHGGVWDAGAISLPSYLTSPKGLAVEQNRDILVGSNASTKKIYRRSHAGGTWEATTGGILSPLQSTLIVDIAVQGEDILCLIKTPNRVYRYSDGSWETEQNIPTSGDGLTANADSFTVAIVLATRKFLISYADGGGQTSFEFPGGAGRARALGTTSVVWYSSPFIPLVQIELSPFMLSGIDVTAPELDVYVPRLQIGAINAGAITISTPNVTSSQLLPVEVGSVTAGAPSIRTPELIALQIPRKVILVGSITVGALAIPQPAIGTISVAQLRTAGITGAGILVSTPKLIARHIPEKLIRTGGVTIGAVAIPQSVLTAIPVAQLRTAGITGAGILVSTPKLIARHIPEKLIRTGGVTVGAVAISQSVLTAIPVAQIRTAGITGAGILVSAPELIVIPVPEKLIRTDGVTIGAVAIAQSVLTAIPVAQLRTAGITNTGILVSAPELIVIPVPVKTIEVGSITVGAVAIAQPPVLTAIPIAQLRTAGITSAGTLVSTPELIARHISVKTIETDGIDAGAVAIAQPVLTAIPIAQIRTAGITGAGTLVSAPGLILYLVYENLIRTDGVTIGALAIPQPVLTAIPIAQIQTAGITFAEILVPIPRMIAGPVPEKLLWIGSVTAGAPTIAAALTILDTVQVEADAISAVPFLVAAPRLDILYIALGQIEVGSVTAGPLTVSSPGSTLGRIPTDLTRVFIVDEPSRGWWELTDIETGAAVKRGTLPAGATRISAGFGVHDRSFLMGPSGWWEVKDVNRPAEAVRLGPAPRSNFIPGTGLVVGLRVFVTDARYDEWWEITDIDTGAAVRHGTLANDLPYPYGGYALGTRAFVCGWNGQWWEITNLDTGAGVQLGTVPRGIAAANAGFVRGKRGFLVDNLDDQLWEITDHETGAGELRGRLPVGISRASAAVAVYYGSQIYAGSVTLGASTIGAFTITVIPTTPVEVESITLGGPTFTSPDIHFVPFRQIEGGSVTAGGPTVTSPGMILPVHIEIGLAVTLGGPRVRHPEIIKSEAFIEVGGPRAGGIRVGNPELQPKLLVPGAASDPSPGDGWLNLGLDTNLGWKEGPAATLHRIHLGATNPPAFVVEEADERGAERQAYDPGSLNENQLYYWRIDTKNALGSTPGPVWRFTTGAAVTKRPPAVTDETDAVKSRRTYSSLPPDDEQMFPLAAPEGQLVLLEAEKWLVGTPAFMADVSIPRPNELKPQSPTPDVATNEGEALPPPRSEY